MTKIVSDLPFLEAAYRYRNSRSFRDQEKDRLLRELTALGVDPALIALTLELSERTVRRYQIVIGLRSSVGQYRR